MYDFAYHRPESIDEALERLSQAEDGVLLAGGQTLIPTLKQRLASPTDVIDLARVDGLAGVSEAKDALVIGAMTRHAAVAGDLRVRARIPALAGLAGRIGDAQVRNLGTIGGSVANNDPAADYPAALLALGAGIRTNRADYSADDFFTGFFETALATDEVITAVSVPIPARAAYMKFPNPASRYAIVGVFVAQGPAGTRVAVTGAGPGVFRVPEMEQALSGDFSSAAIADITMDAADLNSDIHAAADYRAHLVGVMARRAVAACA
jgi:carbon-monoxide dehydrogenase medium subunit